MASGGGGAPALQLAPGFFSKLPRDLPAVPTPLTGDFRHIQQRRSPPPPVEVSQASEALVWDTESSVRSSPPSSHPDTEPAAAGAGPELRVLVMAVRHLERLPVPGRPNCYVTVAVGQELGRTEVAWGMAAPEWGEELTFFPQLHERNRLRCDFGLFHHAPAGGDHCLATASLRLDRWPGDRFEGHTVLLDDVAELSVMLKLLGPPLDPRASAGPTVPDPQRQRLGQQEAAQRGAVEAAELDAWIAILTPFVELERRRTAERYGATHSSSVKSTASEASHASDQETEDGMAHRQRQLWRQQQAELRQLEEEALTRQMAAEPPALLAVPRPLPSLPPPPPAPSADHHLNSDRPHLLRPSELAARHRQEKEAEEEEVERLLNVRSFSLNDDLQLFEGSVADLDPSDLRISKLVSPILRSSMPSAPERPPQSLSSPASPLPPNLSSTSDPPTKGDLQDAQVLAWHTDCSGCCGWPVFESADTASRHPPSNMLQRRPSSDRRGRHELHVDFGLRWSGCGTCHCCRMASYCAAAYSRGHLVL